MSWFNFIAKVVPCLSQKHKQKQKSVKEPAVAAEPGPAYVFKFHIGLFDDVEDRELYRPGGFHPVSIGDKFHGDRYKVLQKMGYGGFATVWLARDLQTQRNVALKITTADVAEDRSELDMFNFISEQQSSESGSLGQAHIVKLLDHFWLDGPNGRHLGLVLPALGPTVQQVMKTSETKRLKGQTARLVSLQAAQTLGYLHSIGLGHGDFRPANLLFAVDGLSQWTEETLRQRLGDIIEEPVMYRDGKVPEEEGIPPTVISPTDYTALIPDFLQKFVYLVDFGEAFRLEGPPDRHLGTPASYCAPECHFDHTASTQTDIWALACTIFEIRAGYPIFQTFMGDYEDEVASQVVTTLGKMPERWWKKWTLRDAFFDDDGKPVQEGMLERVTLQQALREVGTDDEEAESGKEVPGVLCEEEVRDLADLLGKMLKYEPDERIDVQTVLQHRWFTTEYTDAR